MCRINELWFWALAQNKKYCYQFVMRDNLIGGRIDNLLKMGIALSK